MKGKRILILTGIFPPDIGGPATQLDALSRELIKNGFQIQVLTFGSSDNVVYPYSVKRVSNNWPFYLKSFFYLIKGFFLALKTDILYSQDLYTAGLTGLIIKKILRKRLVIRFVENPIWETGCFSQVRKKILFNSDKVIVVSNFVKGLALKIGLPEEKIKVIYNSVGFLKIKPKKLSFKGIMLLTIGRLTPFKGIDMLIEIMPELIKKYNQINLIIIGEGRELNNLKQIVKSLDLENYVFFKGKLNRQQTINYLGTADLFLLNTHHEGMSHTLLEAMKIGTPIITTKAGGNPETIKDGQTGLLVDYKDKEQWLEAISSVLDNPDLAQRLAERAKEDLKRFSWPKLVQETIEVFRSASDL